MGQLKALLPWEGRTLFEHQLASLVSAGASRTMVVLGHDHQRLEPLIGRWDTVQWVLNHDYKQGKATSIKAGLKALYPGGAGASPAPEEALLVLNIDQPRSASTIARVLEHHRVWAAGAPIVGPGRLITLPEYRGKGGHPVVVSTTLLGELLDMSEETLGMKAVVGRHLGELQRVDLGTPEVLLDLNTPQDYSAALAELPTT